jgi:hypothetical protein
MLYRYLNWGSSSFVGCWFVSYLSTVNHIQLDVVISLCSTHSRSYDYDRCIVKCVNERGGRLVWPVELVCQTGDTSHHTSR